MAFFEKGKCKCKAEIRNSGISVISGIFSRDLRGQGGSSKKFENYLFEHIW